ncbi:MAG TPA: ABC transporter permease [Rhodocyclaceae bacterium]|nr:ABC transporter permease [Rhodocyclaceae bacterium]
MTPEPLAMLTLEPSGDLAVGQGRRVVLSGEWTLTGLRHAGPKLQSQLNALAAENDVRWDALAVETMDSAGALTLWRLWGGATPSDLAVQPEHARIFERIAAVKKEAPEPPHERSFEQGMVAIGRIVFYVRDAWADMLVLLGQLCLDWLHLFRHPKEMPWREISANLFKSGVRAMPVTALVGFLIGVVLSYLSALQLRDFGADVFIVNILGLGVVRELGPVLTAVLVAGRSGSAMTAQLGVMRVTEEIDALAAMGVSRSLRLIFPKVLALAIAMPLLVLWTSAAAIIGGMAAAWSQLGMSYEYFLEVLPRVVAVQNLWIAQGKGVSFGIAVALIACYFGLRVRPNTESLSRNTTGSVVVSITAVILIDAIFAIATRGVGVPRL